MTQYWNDAWAVLLELAPWLLLGALIAGLLHVLVPSTFVERQLQGGTGVIKAVLLGVPLPLCSCGVIPTGLGLKRDGASDGATSGFMIATPQTGVDSVLVSGGLLGWPFAITKVIAALVTGIAGGVLTDRLAPSPTGTTNVAEAGNAKRRTLSEGATHALQLLRSIWKWVAFGVLASAALTSFVEPGAFTSLTAQGTIIGFAAVFAISLPLYVCATASVPIAVGLIAAGLPTGAALVFLMAGPATNIATLGAIKATLGLRATAVYLGTIIVGSTAFGLAYEAIFGDFDVDMAHAHEHGSWWRTLSALVLLAAMAWFVWEQATARRRTRSLLDQPVNDAVELGVDGMTCGGCVGKLDKALRAGEGVEHVQVSLDPGHVVVHGAVTDEDVRKLIADAGFEAVG